MLLGGQIALRHNQVSIAKRPDTARGVFRLTTPQSLEAAVGTEMRLIAIQITRSQMTTTRQQEIVLCTSTENELLDEVLQEASCQTKHSTTIPRGADARNEVQECR